MKKIWCFRLLLLSTFVFIQSCKDVSEKKTKEISGSTRITHAQGFQIFDKGDFKLLKINSPWPNSEKSFSYALIPRGKSELVTPNKGEYDAIVYTPVQSLVATSTTHIPAMESLNSLNKLVGFPDTQYISSMPARQLISEGKIRELGNNERLNTEITLELRPDVIVGFAINNENSPYEVLERAGIPVLYNGDWVEQTPLGKAEWIKFFGVLLDKEKEADSIFNTIKTNYNQVKELAKSARDKPSVLSGALYKDVWYLPAGGSWATQFLTDANANYLYADSEGTGSLSLSVESVLEKGVDADFWVSPSQFTSYGEMLLTNSHYQQFKAFQNKRVFTFAATKGATGGLLYYELAPQRPDLVLMDLVRIFHPELLSDYNPYFFTPLQ